MEEWQFLWITMVALSFTWPNQRWRLLLLSLPFVRVVFSISRRFSGSDVRPSFNTRKVRYNSRSSITRVASWTSRSALSDESVLVAQGRSSAARLKALSKVTQKQNRSWKSSLRIDEGSGQRGTLVSLLPSPLPEGLGLPPTMGLPNGSAVPPSVGLSDVSAPLAFPDASALDIGSKQVSDWSQSTTVQQKHAGKRAG